MAMQGNPQQPTPASGWEIAAQTIGLIVSVVLLILIARTCHSG